MTVNTEVLKGSDSDRSAVLNDESPESEGPVIVDVHERAPIEGPIRVEFAEIQVKNAHGRNNVKDGHVRTDLNE